MSSTKQNRFWIDLAKRWRTVSKNDLPETDTVIIEVDPDDMDELDEELDEFLGDLDIEI